MEKIGNYTDSLNIEIFELEEKCKKIQQENTKLQEENEEQKKYFESNMEIRAKLLTRIDGLNYSLEQAYKDIKELQEENERLEKGLEYAKRIEKDYKTKFDKAIEYIKVCKNNDMGIRYQRIEEILQGSDKE